MNGRQTRRVPPMADAHCIGVDAVSLQRSLAVVNDPERFSPVLSLPIVSD
jgi:hypothetical protein